MKKSQFKEGDLVKVTLMSGVYIGVGRLVERDYRYSLLSVWTVKFSEQSHYRHSYGECCFELISFRDLIKEAVSEEPSAV